VSAAKDAGCSVLCEPVLSHIGFTPRADYTPSASATLPANITADVAFNVTDDCRFDTGNTQVVDVSITNPLADMSNYAKGTVKWGVADTVDPVGGGRPAGDAAQDRAQLKVKLYTRALNIAEEQVHPFVIESFGYIHKDAINLLRHLALLRFDKQLAASLLAKTEDKLKSNKRIRVAGYGTTFRRLLEQVAVRQQIGNARMIARYKDVCVAGKQW
jgi:hypothetical protein